MQGYTKASPCMLLQQHFIQVYATAKHGLKSNKMYKKRQCGHCTYQSRITIETGLQTALQTALYKQL